MPLESRQRSDFLDDSRFPTVELMPVCELQVHVEQLRRELKPIGIELVRASQEGPRFLVPHPPVEEKPEVREHMRRIRLQRQRAAKALLGGSAVLRRLLAHATVVPDFRGRVGRVGDDAIVYLQRFGETLLREQQIRQVGERRDLVGTSRQHLAVAALGTGRVAERVVLQAEVDEEAWVSRSKLQCAFEGRDGRRGFVACSQLVTDQEQRFRVARIELERRHPVDPRLRDVDLPARKRCARFSQQRVGRNGRGQDVSAERSARRRGRRLGRLPRHAKRKDISAAHPRRPKASA